MGLNARLYVDVSPLPFLDDLVKEVQILNVSITYFPPATSIPKRRLIVVIVYHVLSTECSEVSQEIREQMELRLQQQNSLWSNGLCRLTNCMDIQLDIRCERVTTSTGRRKRQAPASDITVTITIDDVPWVLLLLISFT